MSNSHFSGNSRSYDENKNASGYSDGDDGWTTCKNIFSLLTGNMTDEGKERFRLAMDKKNEKSDCERCETSRNYLLEYSL